MKPGIVAQCPNDNCGVRFHVIGDAEWAVIKRDELNRMMSTLARLSGELENEIGNLISTYIWEGGGGDAGNTRRNDEQPV